MNFNENPNVGVFCKANDTIAFVRKGLLKKITKKISSILEVKLIELSITDATIIGTLLAINSNGAAHAKLL